MVALFAVLLAASRQTGNLLANPSFAKNWEGWLPIWSRKDGSATATIQPGRQPSERAIAVRQEDSQDWSVSQQAQIPVQPRQIYELSGWMKSEGGSAEISLVSRDPNGKTLDWSLGSASPPSGDWQFVHSRCLIPPNCKTVQFRLIGSGAGRTWLASPSLFLQGSVAPLPAKTAQLLGSQLKMVIHSDGSMSATPKGGHSWDYRAWPGSLVLTSFKTLGPRHAEWEALDFNAGQTLRVALDVSPTAPEATVSVTCVQPGPKGSATFEPVPAPGALVTQAGQYVVLPMNEGIRFPVEDSTIDGWSLITYGGHGLCMPWSGVYEPNTGAGAMTIVETPDDADVLFQKQDGFLTFQPRWEATRQEFGYTRKLQLRYFANGGYIAMAKHYRAYAKAIGLFKTLAAKAAENPNVDRLIGAVNVWNWDMDKLALCREMKQEGFDRVLWSGGGSAEEIRGIAALGYLPGRYDIYQDVWDPKHSLSWQNTDGWPQDLVLEPDGNWMKGWAHPDRHADGTITWYQGGVISSGAGLARAKEKIPADLAQIPYMARFIDTTTASPFREDYNPLHPLTRGQDRANKMALLDFCSKDLKQVVGTETGIDPSVPHVEYYEGMMSLGPFRLPDSGTQMMDYRKPTPEFLKFQVGPAYRIPLWELVYHDCTVAQWYWGDATNKAPEVWDQRDLLNILYGTAPLLMFDQDRWKRDKERMFQTYKNVCHWTRKIGYDEMLTHIDLTPDHSVQRTTWSSGRSVTVNFGPNSYQGIPAKSFAFSGPK